MTVDLLLLNATNLPWRPIFPYAFVQVSALARRAGLRVQVLDLLNVPRDRWQAMLSSVIDHAKPRMVGLHIRQGDSVFLDDYYVPNAAQGTMRNYFPVEDNRELVRVLRATTNAPLIAGGFGFTTHARRMFEYLELDYGAQGDPDDVIANFENLLAGRELASVKSLIYRDGGQTRMNERGFYMPQDEREYTDEIVDELVKFYGHSVLFGADPPTVPVEIMRGCPFSCFFCTEPHVKGKSFRYRDLDVVEAELEFLVARQIRRFWLVCSELDIQGTKFAMQLAERIVRLRERTGGAPIEWSAYALPRIEEDELRVLQRAGYVGALNDVLSLDDANLRRARVPYRSKQAVAFLKAVQKLDQEEAGSATNAASAESKIRAGLTQRTPKELAATIGLFLGNAHADADTIKNTLRRIEDEGLRESYRAGLPFPSTRVFAPDGEPFCETTPRGLRTYGRDGVEREVDMLWPTFYYPDFLIEKLGSPAAVIDFMRYVGETFMSTGHRTRKDWPWFLAQHTSLDAFVALVESAGIAVDRGTLAELFIPHASQRTAANNKLGELLGQLWAALAPRLARVRTALGVEPGWSEFKIIEQLSRRFVSRDALLEATAPDDIERLYVDWLLYANNVVLRPEYRELLF
jgi:hypothetical protein